MIAELYGLPGSGKSTTCNKLKETKELDDIMFFYKEKLLGKIIYHLFLILFPINPKLNKVYKKINNKLSKYLNNKNKIDASVPLSLYIKYIVFIFYIENKYAHKKNKGICIDEGVIHLCIAIHAEFDVPISLLDDIIEITSGALNRKLVRVDCSIEDAIIRMKKRNRKRAPIDYLDEHQLKELLKDYKKAEEYFNDKYNECHITVD